jgi:DNA polymerase
MLSVLDWWRDAGVDALVEEAPRDWLVTRPPAQILAPVLPQEAALPTTIEAMHAWLATADVPLSGPPSARLATMGDPASGLMVIGDVPEIGDAQAGKLFAGEIGLLFDRMLAAIGRDRASIYLATLATTRTPDGRIDEPGCRALAPIAQHHIGLVRPKVVLLLGGCVSQALLGLDLPQARGRLHMINQDGATMACVATFHPRFLFTQPAAKAEAWKDLRLLLGELSR